MSTLYETDFQGWIEEQTELLKQGRFSELDVPNLLEEMGLDKTVFPTSCPFISKDVLDNNFWPT